MMGEQNATKQNDPCPQTLSQLPHAALLPIVLTHVPEQHCSPFDTLHLCPHAPQLKGSDILSVHPPPQHSLPCLHSLPHLPQLWLSVSTSVHEPPQHLSPCSHLCPHEPQLCLSFWRLTHFSGLPQQSPVQAISDICGGLDRVSSPPSSLSSQCGTRQSIAKVIFMFAHRQAGKEMEHSLAHTVHTIALGDGPGCSGVVLTRSEELVVGNDLDSLGAAASSTADEIGRVGGRRDAHRGQEQGKDCQQDGRSGHVGLFVRDLVLDSRRGKTDMRGLTIQLTQFTRETSGPWGGQRWSWDVWYLGEKLCAPLELFWSLALVGSRKRS